jgi:hypothetical protein
MPQATLDEGFQTSGENIIKAALPAWVARSTVTAKLYGNDRPQWKVGFRCDCKTTKQYVPVVVGDQTIQQVAKAAHDQIEAKHGACNGQTTAPAPLKREAQLEAELACAVKRQKTLQREVSAAEADKGAAAKLAAAATTQRRLDTTATGRRKEIDYSDCDTKLDRSGKHDALHGRADRADAAGADNGLLDCVKYWARGSLGIVFQLVMALIATFKLRDMVSAACLA